MLRIMSEKKVKDRLEAIMAALFIGCAIVSVLALICISIYMFIAGIPAIMKIGIKDILFSDVWAPTAASPQFGILNIILTSIVGVFVAVCLGVPIGLFTAIYLSEIATPKSSRIISSSVELLAGIPSVVYGLLGILIVCPLVYQLELFIYRDSLTHQFTGGSNLISAIIVLTIMILPTLINMSLVALKSVSDDIRMSSLALGATHIQTIFKIVLPASKKGIMSAIVLGVGRAIGEAMAILLVAGNSVNVPYAFNSVRFLTTGIVSEMGYSSGLHREVLFTIGLVLFVFIVLLNLLLSYILKGGNGHGR